MSDPTPTPAKETYRSSCHCGAIAYRTTHTSFTDPTCVVAKCNCSICVRNGYLFIYPSNDDVVFENGSLEDMTAYKFSAAGKVAHYFCATCGSSCMARSVEPGFFDGVTCVNVRLIEGVDLDALTYKEMDGRSYKGGS